MKDKNAIRIKKLALCFILVGIVMVGIILKFTIPLILLFVTEKRIELPSSYFVFLLLFLSLLQLVIVYTRENLMKSLNLHRINDLLRKMQTLPYESLLSERTISIIKRLYSMVDSLYMLLTGSWPTLFISGISIVICCIIGFISHRWIGFIWLCCVPINYFGFKKINRILSEKMRRMHQSNAESM